MTLKPEVLQALDRPGQPRREDYFVLNELPGVVGTTNEERKLVEQWVTRFTEQGDDCAGCLGRLGFARPMRAGIRNRRLVVFHLECEDLACAPDGVTRVLSRKELIFRLREWLLDTIHGHKKPEGARRRKRIKRQDKDRAEPLRRPPHRVQYAS